MLHLILTLHQQEFMLNGLLDELGNGLFCLASATNGLTILHLSGIVPHCEPDNAPYWSKRKQMEEYGS